MENSKNHPQVNFGKTGVLIINLGTPDSTSWLDIRNYLKEFLSDRRVIEVNPILWQIILNIFILNSETLSTQQKNLVGYFAHGLKLKSYVFEKYKSKKQKGKTHTKRYMKKMKF